MDLLELWELLDPHSCGIVTLSNFIQQLRGERPKSPVPGPSHYKPNPSFIERAVERGVRIFFRTKNTWQAHTAGRGALTLDVYSRPSCLVAPLSSSSDVRWHPRSAARAGRDSGMCAD